MDYWLVAYIVITILLGTGFVAMMYKRGQIPGAMILLVLLLLVFVFYGLRWFKSGTLKGTESTTGPWPPIVNMCPDFMVSYTDAVGKVYCHDATNTYDLKTNTIAGMTTSITINNVPGQTAFLIKDPSRNTSATELKMDTDGTRWPLLANLKNNPGALMNDPRGKFVRWEGVWDGRSLTTENAPLP